MRLYRCKANGDGSEAAAASPATSRPDEQEMAEVSRTTDDALPFYSATCPRSAEPDSTTTTPDSSQSNTVADEADLERGDEATSSEADGCMKQLTREQHIVVSVIVGIPLMLLFGYFFWMYGAMVIGYFVYTIFFVVSWPFRLMLWVFLKWIGMSNQDMGFDLGWDLRGNGTSTMSA